MHEELVIPEDQYAILYFSAEEGNESPELLFFEERLIHDPGWKRASRKGRQLWQKARQFYDDYAVDFFAPDRFVRRLPTIKKITVLLNRPIDPAVVRDRLRKILRDRSYHHLRWLIVDLILLPLALFTVPLPGPNLWGYYLLFRVLSHWKSYRSAAKTRLDEVDILVSRRAEEVNSFFRAAKDIRTGLKELRRKYGLRALQEQQFIPQKSAMKEALMRRLHHSSSAD